ncbi:hypothetical protein BV898_15929 [Hypsibius exemplaris]|uniref:TATA box-binding protein-associated factor RNA polymerase I subunit A n=1 Tax=Hypsibius exemplaris TaxID=2072580 RepID=A0A9X6NE32_HYPEX|nr:hypothetical protein BV898_15929 [Hypsibius exemplaris]
MATQTDGNNSLLAEEEAVLGFFGCRTGFKIWKERLLACIHHRRFRLAAQICQYVLLNLGISQDIWLWRVITDKMSTQTDGNNSLLAEEEAVLGFFGCRTGFKIWKERLLACIHHRRFRLAAQICQYVLLNLGISQDIWLWRVVVVVLANLDTSDDVYNKLYRVIYFGKTVDYEERRLCLFFLMMKRGKVKIALSSLEKDMPKRMSAGLKKSANPSVVAYEARYHAMLQMWRGIASFWKEDTSGDENAYQFNYQRFGQQAPKKKQVVQAASPELFTDDSDDGVERTPPPERTAAARTNSVDFVKAVGEEIMHKFSVDRVLEMFECFLDRHESMDTYMKHYIELCEIGEFFDRLERTLRRYAERNSSHPTALKFLLEHYRRRKPDDVDIRRRCLEHLCQLVPYGSHVTLLADDLLLAEDDTETKTICELIVPALGYRCHWTDSSCWTWMASIVRRVTYMTDDVDAITCIIGHCNEVATYWNVLHFRFPERDQEDGKLLYVKIQVCWALYGAAHAFVGKGQALLSSKYRKKLAKRQSDLDEVHRILTSGQPANSNENEEFDADDLVDI